MLRYEFEDAGKQIVFVHPAEVVSIQSAPAYDEQIKAGEGFCFVTLSNNVRVTIPRSPDAFAAEVEKALAGDDP